MQNDYLNNKKKINQKKETKNTVQINSLSKKKKLNKKKKQKIRFKSIHYQKKKL